ncbi:hypothetical protein L873DRAFT_1808985 [Choiromyces venosus 120613-1]|uniref:Uncharacterized protein n=1 Tax=Choiromyces venosus 120613-1 TaxID=1336337 RepID=A0A3N4JW02_9PEZI|nr:hypothetical protein L873DRAFT_1808985 [Choiromyces venosus 120613-1]
MGLFFLLSFSFFFYLLFFQIIQAYFDLSHKTCCRPRRGGDKKVEEGASKVCMF